MILGKKLYFLIGVVVALSACSTPPSVGEQIRTQGAETKELGKKWIDGDHLINKGNKRITSGESMVIKGEKLIAQGKHQIHEGHAMIKKGKMLENKSENAFHENFPDVSTED